MLSAMVPEVISYYDYMQGKIIFRIVNRNNNTQYLKDNVYLPFFNFAVCFYVLANYPQEDGTVGSIALTKGLLDADILYYQQAEDKLIAYEKREEKQP